MEDICYGIRGTLKKGGINWFDGMIGICDCIGTDSCIMIYCILNVSASTSIV